MASLVEQKRAQAHLLRLEQERRRRSGLPPLAGEALRFRSDWNKGLISDAAERQAYSRALPWTCSSCGRRRGDCTCASKRYSYLLTLG